MEGAANLENLRKLASANNEFAFNMHRRLTEGTSDNVFFSPLSVFSVFSMLYYGSVGETSEELRKALGYDKADIKDEVLHQTFSDFLKNLLRMDRFTNDTIIHSANAVFVNRSMNIIPEFRRNIKEWYGASFQEVDFSKDSEKVIRSINDWAKDQTHQKLKHLIGELNPATLMVLLNALYFKAAWRTPFHQNNSEKQDFFNNGQESEKKDMSFMTTTGEFRYSENDDFKALELPFKGDDVIMFILSPKKRNGLKSLEKNVTPNQFLTIHRELDEKIINFSVPKFKLKSEKDLSSVLKTLGVKRMFDPKAADFSDINFEGNSYVSQVLHKVEIIINEKGSEASAATGVISCKETSPEFAINHPFLFAIIEKGSGSEWILLLGRINNL
ncbi:uncharacterized serpin-like protein MA_2246 [Trichonephila clavata]|uniref:Uncharacterized serpin-like protein MA_2246 n=1 Tax=Trichonephila clavata TaxID=2740835 RepID=A0A8X6M1T9_TRICU|nr:uncharacterized serpin-like protein MA_2246 [Trichonephila clavata]